MKLSVRQYCLDAQKSERCIVVAKRVRHYLGCTNSSCCDIRMDDARVPK